MDKQLHFGRLYETEIGALEILQQRYLSSLIQSLMRPSRGFTLDTEPRDKLDGCTLLQGVAQRTTEANHVEIEIAQ